ncbi:MAG TPA: carbohydrate-binding family 9-like protein [Pyrinomonadaceae bacterium]|jgi:hypothetical protein|nr:carbohydrate-binding family 9-like protein [Pyrinomonadaceae bacterium]
MTREPNIAAPYSEANLTAGDFDHPGWDLAHPIQITRKWSGEGAPVSRHAEARIIWTDKSLFVRFLCRQQEPLTVNPNPQLSEKTMRLWDRDVCEIFLAPDTNSPERYFEFEASPLGEWIDLAICLNPTGRETDFAFNSSMTVAARVAGEQLAIGMKIPWSQSLPQPRKGDSWRVNLFRCVGVGDDRYLAWQPTFAPEPNFHVPEVFGWLEFL